MIDDARTECWTASVASHPHDITKILKKIPVPAEAIRVAIEPVAGWRWVSELLTEAGMEVHIANPLKVALIAKSDQKHDVGDARILAELLASGYFPESYRVTDDIYELRTLLRERQYIIKLRTSAKNRLHGIATTQGLHTITGGNPLHVRGKQSIMERGSVVLRELHHLIEDLSGRIVPLDRLIEEYAATYPLASLLKTMPCVGNITALTVIAEVGDFARFSSGKKLAKFAGLVPRQRSSGERVRFGSLTNSGSRFLRTALVETAMRIRKGSAPELYAHIESLAPRIGQKKARVALARKLLTVMWTMVYRNTPYTQTAFLARVRNTHLSDLDTEAGT
jgi:transposase